MNEAGLVSVEYSSIDKTVTFTYEPHSGYLFADIIAYAGDLTDRIDVYEGSMHMVTLKKMEGGWVELMTPPKR